MHNLNEPVLYSKKMISSFGTLHFGSEKLVKGGTGSKKRSLLLLSKIFFTVNVVIYHMDWNPDK